MNTLATMRGFLWVELVELRSVKRPAKASRGVHSA